MGLLHYNKSKIRGLIMRINGVFSVGLACLVSILSSGAFAQQATYLPTGVQQSVPIATVTGDGWTECFREGFDGNNISAVADVLANCPGADLMMACSPTGSDTLTLLAQASRADVTFEAGTGNVTNNANGVEWYFNDSYSWGFAPGGETVSRNSCDTASTQGDLRMCIHTGGGFIQDGYRCGNNNLNGDATWERIIFAANAAPSQPVPALPFWVLGLLCAGLAGLVGSRLRRRA